MNITIRQETAADHDAIRHVNQAAFGQDAEAELVDALRDGGFVRLSLIAENDGKVVGHILFSKLNVVDVDKPVVAVALAPVAVLPDDQRKGIGSELIQKGLSMCREKGVDLVFVLGDPAYYRRFGFSSELAARFRTPYPGEAFMAQELAPGSFGDISGEVVYPLPFERA